jgi:hypothetical protein
VQEELASLGVFYEGVVLLGARDHDVALWSDRGYVSDWQSGSAFVGHFKGCHLDVVVADAPSDSSARFNVRVGDYQLISDAHPPPHIAADGVAHFDIARAPCGEDVAVKVRWVRATGAAPAFCQNADASGELHAAITRSSGVVRCTPP